MLQKQRGSAEGFFEELQYEYGLLKEEFIQENLEISTVITALDLACVSNEYYTAPNDTDFTFWTKSRRKYLLLLSLRHEHMVMFIYYNFSISITDFLILFDLDSITRSAYT